MLWKQGRISIVGNPVFANEQKILRFSHPVFHVH